MRLTGCYIENFGVLHNYRVNFINGCNVFCEKNGWGKSTLAAFIRVMFYGFEGEARRDDISNERRRYTPWQGGVYGGEVSFISDRKEYIIRRTFGSRKKEDRYALYDARTRMECNDYSSETGCELFGMDSESFMKTVYISERDCLTHTTDNINRRISNLAYDTDDEHNYETADKRMMAYINNMSPTRKTGKLYGMKEKLTELKVSIAKKDTLIKELKECEKRLGGGFGTGTGSSIKRILTAIVLLVLIILVTEIAGITLLLYKNMYGYAVMVLGVFLTCMTLHILRKKRRDNSSVEDIKNDRSSIRLLKRTEEIKEELNNIESMQLRYEELTQTYNHECKKYDNVLIARELLKQAKASFFADFMPDIKKWFDVYCNLFGKRNVNMSGDSTRYQIDADISIYADEKGMLRNIETMSLGKRDVAGICMRMALIESMYKDEKPFIIIDDPFTGIDDETMEYALDFINNISSRYQVIYFTCHKSRVPIS